MDDEKRELVVRRELEKAYSELQTVAILVDNQRWSAAAGRAYYALFHAVSALLIHDAHPVKSHKGAYVMLSKHYIAMGKMPKKYGDFYKEMETLREESDYNCFYDVVPEKLLERLPLAKEMIDTISAMVRAN